MESVGQVLKELKELISQRKQILSGLHSAVGYSLVTHRVLSYVPQEALADLKSKVGSCTAVNVAHFIGR